MATTYLSRTSGTPTDSKKTTLSVWLKRSGLGTGTFFGGGTDANNMTFINFNPNGKIFLQSSSSGSNTLVFVTTQVFKDTNAWYNIIVAIDTTQGTASNRVKLYVNGVQVTAFDVETYPAEDLELEWNKSGKPLEIGKYLFQSTYSVYDGLMSHFNFVDGTQELPTAFGETDSTTGEWKIKTSPSVTYGNNGFFILKDGNSVTDQSGEGNNFAVTAGTLTNTKDCPSSVFATLNPLIKASNQPTFTNGNTTVISPSGTNARYGGTLGMTSGKYYYEVKLLGSISNGGFGAGILNIDSFNFNSTSGISTSSNYIGVVVNSLGGAYNFYIQHGGATNDFSQTLSVGMIIGHAIDMDNGYYYVHNNGVYINSGDPTSGATGTGNINRTGNLNYDFSNLTMVVGGTSQNVDYGSFNFGNGTFGTTAIASAGTNASNNGVFEYDVPTGYTALSTKGLNL